MITKIKSNVLAISAFFLLALLVSCVEQPIDKAGTPAQNLTRNVEMLKNGDASEVETQAVDYYQSSIGFLARPKKDGIYPGIIMIHEFWGLNDNIKEMAKQLAAEGYVVLAVDLYDGKVGADSNESRALATKVRNNPSEAIKNLKGAVESLKKQSNVDRDKIASIGWCFGGQWSLQLALNEKMAATIIYYGSLETNTTMLSVIKCPVLFIFGDQDTAIPVESARKFNAALDELGIENEIYIYPGVGHAFANPSGMNYAPAETKDAWEKTLRFLEKHLKGPG